MQQAPSAYYPALAGLRVVAATLVFMGHHAYALPAGTAAGVRRQLEGGYMGVSLFFVLSGYLMAYRYFNEPFRNSGDYFRYLGQRLARIFPVYWLVLGGLYLQWLFTIPELLLHASLLKGFFPHYQLAGVVQAWSLTTELTFYALAPLLFYLIRTRSLAWTWGASILLGLLLAGLGSKLTGGDSHAYQLLPDLKNMAWFTFFGRSTEFFAGIYLYRFLAQLPPGAKKLSASIPLTYAGVLLFFTSYGLINGLATAAAPGVSSWPGLLLHHLLLPVGIWVFLYGLLVEETRLRQVLSLPLVVALGNASYVFYLVHLGWIRNWMLQHLTNSVILLFGMMWVLSLLVHYLLEKPIYRWLQRRISGTRSY